MSTTTKMTCDKNIPKTKILNCKISLRARNK